MIQSVSDTQNMFQANSVQQNRSQQNPNSQLFRIF